MARDQLRQGPASFWTDAGLPGPAAARLAGRWIMGADTAVARLTPVSLIWLADEVRDPSAARIEPVVHLARADSGRLTGTPVVVAERRQHVVDNPGGDAGELTLSAFEESASVVPPSSAVDLASVG